MDKLTYIKKNLYNQGKNDFYCDLNFFLEFDKIADIKNKNILDIGCGEGRLLTLFSLIGKAKSCWGLDSAEGIGSDLDILELFKKNINALSLKNIKIIKDDIWNYDSGNIKFDVITAVYSLHHIFHTKKNLLKDKDLKNKGIALFTKIYDLLKKPGIFILYEASKYDLKGYCEIYRKLLKASYVNYKTKHTAKEYSTLLKKSGFRDVYTKYYFRSYYLNKFKWIFSVPIINFFINNHYFIFSIKR